MKEQKLLNTVVNKFCPVTGKQLIEERNWHKKRILRSQIWIRRNRFEDFKAPTQQAKMPVIDKADGLGGTKKYQLSKFNGCPI